MNFKFILYSFLSFYIFANKKTINKLSKKEEIYVSDLFYILFYLFIFLQIKNPQINYQKKKKHILVIMKMKKIMLEKIQKKKRKIKLK